MKKLYIVNKFIFAESIEDALRLEAGKKPDEIFLDGDWKKNMAEEPEKDSQIGYGTIQPPKNISTEEPK